MKAVLISCFNYYDNRLKYIEEYLKKNGYTVYYITSDFDHISKKKYTINRKNTIQLKVMPYSKNLSIKRVLSHLIFSYKVYRELNKINPDLVYSMLPPNFLAFFTSLYKKKKKNRLIYDIYDLWPESFPNKDSYLAGFVFDNWKKLRNRNLKNADLIYAECNLFREKLDYVLNGLNTKTLYLTKNSNSYTITPKIENNKINICYLGSINNIIDISAITLLLKKINYYKPVTLHIIGDGESRDVFIKEIKKSGIDMVYYGKIYDDFKKAEIFNKCSFGINMMKDTVCVGLTMKSIDYFQAGLPILNNISGDTAEIVDKYKIGFNITENNLQEIGELVSMLSKESIIDMRKRTVNVFEHYFSIDSFKENVRSTMNELI